jgi:hypothetical protein
VDGRGDTVVLISWAFRTIQERLIPLARKHEGIDFFLVSQADVSRIHPSSSEIVALMELARIQTETTKDYLTKLPVEGDLTNPPFSIISSPEPHSLYSTWGISQLSLSSVINMDILGSVKDLAREKNIKNTLTVGSRWLNSGGFAVDKEGKIVWTHVAERSDDVSDLDAAVKALGI